MRLVGVNLVDFAYRKSFNWQNFERFFAEFRSFLNCTWIWVRILVYPIRYGHRKIIQKHEKTSASNQINYNNNIHKCKFTHRFISFWRDKIGENNSNFNSIRFRFVILYTAHIIQQVNRKFIEIEQNPFPSENQVEVHKQILACIFHIVVYINANERKSTNKKLFGFFLYFTAVYVIYIYIQRSNDSLPHSGCPWYLNNLREKSQGYIRMYKYIYTMYEMLYTYEYPFYSLDSGSENRTNISNSTWVGDIGNFFYYTHTGCHGTCWMFLRVISTDVSRRYTMPWRKKKRKSLIRK